MKLVIFHSYVNIYQRVLDVWRCWNVITMPFRRASETILFQRCPGWNPYGSRFCRCEVYDWNGVWITLILFNFHQIQVIHKVIIVHGFVCFAAPCFSTPVSSDSPAEPSEWQAPQQGQHWLYLADSDREMWGTSKIDQHMSKS